MIKPDKEEKHMNKADEFLKALRENPEIRAYAESHELPEGKSYEDGLAELAKHFGFDVAKEELGDALKAAREKIREGRIAAEDAIRELDTDEIAKVVGGAKGNARCEETFEYDENCWKCDKCNFITNEYCLIGAK
jgi:hypothetical protein